MKKIFFVLVMLLGISTLSSARTYKIQSPANTLQVEISIDEEIAWSLYHDGDLVMGPSVISLTLEQQGILGNNTKVGKVTYLSVNQTIQTPVYKKKEVVDLYNQITLKMRDGWGLEFRAYEEGVAYRITTTFKKDIKVMNEQAEFVFPNPEKAWVPYARTRKERYMTSFESTYDVLDLKDVKADSLIITPLLVEAGKGRKVVITEADLEDYPGMFVTINASHNGFRGTYAPYPLAEEKGGHNNLQSIVTQRADYIAKTKGTRTFPWRVVAVSANDADLLDNDLVVKLASPARITDLSWIKPGKVAWDWWNDLNITGVDFRSGINNETYRYYIDFAAEHGVEYVILDEGWSEQSSLLNVKPHIDLPDIVNHAKERGVGIILWGGWMPLDAEMDKVLEVYSKMGVAGFKVDFMDRDDQKVVNFYYRLARKAAEHKLIIDFHGAFKPTGLQHTYPNVINMEGVYGLENVKWTGYTDFPGYDVTIPFIRGLAGPMDYTPGAMLNANRQSWRAISSTPMSQGTRCHQLAMYVVYESPLAMMADNPTHYMREGQSTAFIAAIPTVFDETVTLGGQLGEYVAMARRKGDNWYIGAMTNWVERETELDFSFLGDGTYEAVVFRDGINADRNAADYKREVITVTKNTQMKIKMAPGGGWAAELKPVQ